MKFLLSFFFLATICSAQTGWVGTWKYQSDTCGVGCSCNLVITSASAGTITVDVDIASNPSCGCTSNGAQTLTISGNNANFNGQTVFTLAGSVLQMAATNANNQACQVLFTLSASKSKCFPADAIVQLKDGTQKSMKELAIGDVILSKPNVWSEVFMFSHRTIQTKSLFISLQTNNSMVSLTPDHYIYANGKLVVARQIQVGDMLVNEKNLYEKVTSIKSEYKVGLYNPHTMNGDVIVNGIWTSTYTQAVEPHLAHMALAPIRALYSNGINIMEG